ncbi:olfactory receptor 56B4-like, partial [Sinocyclocheilus rhinocerous]|uniref:olfactory receptor 56B4-like n=1 Tax=Sinocyclocheilus rhinocerous TaxID=307959 RepID=UPI0007B99562
GEWRPFLFIRFFLIFLLAITANSILIYLIKSQKSLHSPMYVLIGVMAVLNLILPIFFVPNIMLLSFLFNWGGISLTGCLIQMFGIHFVGAFQSTLLLWMALDRYFAICKPLNYHKYMEIANFSKLVFVPLIRNGFLMVTIVSLAGKLTFCRNIIDHCLCEHMALVQLACGDISVNNIVGLLSAFIIPTTHFILITISYIVIFTSVFRSGKAHFKAIN